MPRFSLFQETTSNSNTGGLFQILAAAGREMRLLAVCLQLGAEASNKDIGTFVVDRLTAIGSTNWDSQTPFELDPGGAASAVTDATKTVEATCNGSGHTASDVGMLLLAYGWNDFTNYNIMSGAAGGFLVRRTTAPSGARVVAGTMIWEE